MRYKVWTGTGNIWTEHYSWEDACAKLYELIHEVKCFTAHVEICSDEG